MNNEQQKGAGEFELSRRPFLLACLGGLTALYGLAVGWMAGWFGASVAPLPPADPHDWALTDQQRATLDSTSRLILPGAEQARIIVYLERTLASSFWLPRRDWFLAGVEVLESLAQAGWQQSYANLATNDQAEMLTHVQHEGADTDDFDGPAFVHALIELCLEGFLCDPVHGGNRGQTGWRYIGFVPGCPRH